MAKYLYGAAVQGIQSFIFQTNKLQEIVGASELVEKICTNFFRENVKTFKDENLVLAAAGNIKYIFDNETDCQDLVMKFPKAVMELAPGITISQAVIEFNEGGLNKALQNLEDKLREQRNKVSMPFEMGFMGIERARRTGGVAFEPNSLPKEDEIIDEATVKKIKASKGSSIFDKISNKLPINEEKDLWNNVDKLFNNENKAWIAVIHADGNGLGAIIQNMNKALQSRTDEDVKKGFKTFSQSLDEATKSAAQTAFNEIVKDEKEEGLPFPIRPIILGGDDLTVIIRADLAFNFTVRFLEEFEKKTADKFKFLKGDFQINGFENGISACAGIAYIKKSYPFHYAVSLAEKLCAEAKNFVKKEIGYKGFVPKSALSFFKVQDSFIESDLKTIKKRTLTAQNLSFDYGPYLVGNPLNGYAHVNQLFKKMATIEEWEKRGKEEANGVSKLRQWVTEAFNDESTATFMEERMKFINSGFYNEISPLKEDGKSIIFDVIQLNSLKN